MSIAYFVFLFSPETLSLKANFIIFNFLHFRTLQEEMVLRIKRIVIITYFPKWNNVHLIGKSITYFNNDTISYTVRWSNLHVCWLPLHAITNQAKQIMYHLMVLLLLKEPLTKGICDLGYI